MFIKIENTPNPDAIKFITEKKILIGENINISSKKTTNNIPLAQKLFTISSIKSIFFGPNFITIIKISNTKWEKIKSIILEILTKYFNIHDTVEIKNYKNTITNHEINELYEEVNHMLNTKIKPILADDGGDVILQKIENGIVFIKMQGACSGCPTSSLTIKSGIENMLKYYIPEIKEVKEVK